MDQLIAPTGVTETDRERFMSYVVVLPSGCWEWCGLVNENGYGVFSVKGVKRRAHRVAFELDGGDPGGLPLDHTCHDPGVCRPEDHRGCRHRRCVNPEHVEPVSGRENTLRGGSTAAVRAKQTECVHGHPFDDLNTYRRADRPRVRECLTCRREASRRSRQKAASAA